MVSRIDQEAGEDGPATLVKCLEIAYGSNSAELAYSRLKHISDAKITVETLDRLQAMAWGSLAGLLRNLDKMTAVPDLHIMLRSMQ